MATILQRRQHIDAGTYVGSGKVIEIAHLARQEDADVIIFDNDLSPAQVGALETQINKELGSPRGQGVKVLDRSELILDIFATPCPDPRGQAPGRFGPDAIHLSAADQDVGAPGTHRHGRQPRPGHARPRRNAA